MQTILPYSRDSTSAAMPVICSCQSCRCYRYLQYLQQEKRTLSPPIRYQKRERAYQICFRHGSRCLSVSDESSPLDEHDGRDDIQRDAVVQQPLPSLGNEQTSGAGQCDYLSRRLHGTHVDVGSRALLSAACTRSRHMAAGIRDTRRPALKSRREGTKEEQVNQIAECTSVAFSLFSLLFTVLVQVCVGGVSIFS